MPKKCKACDNNVFGGGYCIRHQWKRTDKPSSQLKRVGLKRPRIVTGEGVIFCRLIKERPHVSWLTGKKIENISHVNCAHVVAKGNTDYAKWSRLDSDNIVFMTQEEHFLYDQGTEEQRTKYFSNCLAEGLMCRWHELFELKEKLTEKYKALREESRIEYRK